MAHYNVKFSCGHEQCIELFGKTSERERKIKWYEECGVCSECYKEQKAIEMSINHDEVEMSYKQYKTEYANCKTKPGSYNGETKTIVVYVPRANKE